MVDGGELPGESQKTERVEYPEAVSVIECMKRSALILSILTALVLTPTASFAKDKKDRNCNNVQAQIEADRRANGYYDAPRYSPDNCAPRWCPPDQRRDYSRGYDRGGYFSWRGR